LSVTVVLLVEVFLIVVEVEFINKFRI
jgi:hypothetical protein